MKQEGTERLRQYKRALEAAIKLMEYAEPFFSELEQPDVSESDAGARAVGLHRWREWGSRYASQSIVQSVSPLYCGSAGT